MTPISLVDLPVSLTGPDPSGSARPSRLRRGCSHPPRQPADQAASSFIPPLRRQDHGVFHLHPKQQRIVAQAYVLHFIDVLDEAGDNHVHDAQRCLPGTRGGRAGHPAGGFR
jgi:hypothetical protein